MPALTIRKLSDALIITDLQNDFCKGGTLEVPLADQIVEPINKILPLFPFVVSTQDWHPPNHISFKAQGGPWPPHCVRETHGAGLHPGLNQKEIDLRIYKGEFPDREAYSGFQETRLAHELKKRDITRVFIVGLTTNYCVKETAQDALKHGFTTVVLTDLIRAVNLRPEDEKHTLEKLARQGIRLASAILFCSGTGGNPG
ncbi:MAG TPA: nicotinamidase [Candidatus Omnitrophota bacterium]|nr:nicotinamidase [Candidatus Omnitrophota bacterium]